MAQNGRLTVSSPEVLLFWAAMCICLLGTAVNAMLTAHTWLGASTWLPLGTLALALGTLAAEVRHGGDYSFDNLTIFEKVSASFVRPVLDRATKAPLRTEDFPVPLKSLGARQAHAKFARVLDRWSPFAKLRVIGALHTFLGGCIFRIVALRVLAQITQLVQPVLFQNLLHALSLYTAGQGPLYKCYYHAASIGACHFLSRCFMNLAVFEQTCGSTAARVSLMSAIYQKALRLDPRSRAEYDAGKLMNMVSVDTGQLFALVDYLPVFVTAPMSIVWSCYQLWQFMGPSFVAAGAVYLLVLPSTSLVSAQRGKVYLGLMKLRDRRNQLTADLFRNIKSLKLYAWERPFFDRITDLRWHKELKIDRFIKIGGTFLEIMWLAIGDVVTVAVFTAFLFARRGALTPEIVFPSLVLLDMASEPFVVLPIAIPMLYQAVASQTRINELLQCPDHTYRNYLKTNGDGSVEMREAVVAWPDEESTVALDAVSLQAARGDLMCITGRVGAGKTALLKALGGELQIESGSVAVHGSLSYCSQEPWLQNLTIRDNILFGQQYNPTWYSEVLDACELKADLEQMPLGDLTEIGERGISLSGGQKARVALARAVYTRADVYLFDDVLSAVDEHVGAALITKLFSREGLLANRTVVLATNNLRVLPHSSLIVELQNKKVAESLPFATVLERGDQSQIYRLIREFGNPDDLDVDRNSATPDPGVGPCLPTLAEVPLKLTFADIKLVGQTEEEEENADQTPSAWAALKRYYTFANPWCIGGAAVLIVVSAICSNMLSIYLGYMSMKAPSNLKEGTPYLLSYLSLIVLWVGLEGIAQVLNDIIIGQGVSRRLHDRMLWSVVRAPMAFFDRTPLGRLINRFAGDINSVDVMIPWILRSTMRMMAKILVVMTSLLIGSPVLVFLLVPLGYVANQIRALYTPARRKSMRIVQAANSPILSHIEDSLKGQAVLRILGRTNFFVDVYEQRVDYWVRAESTSADILRWLTFNMDTVIMLLSVGAAVSATYFVGIGYISVGFGAVVVTFGRRVGALTRSLINSMSQIETAAVSLARALEYIDLPQEAPMHQPTRPPVDWPQGELEFRNVRARYTDTGPDVLKAVTFALRRGEKIGVVGRTGSGKSSLTLAIFRLLEPHSGHITADGLDTSVLGLTDLRSHLSIIPQDAQIFSGTVRANLDPLQHMDDQQLWEVLETCHLKAHFEKEPLGLDTGLSDGGANLSRGEAQLLCLGRALLHESKILVLDEATASVDVKTDRLIQDTIRSSFADRTIVTIAHRLNTILDSDRVMVLDRGEIREFDSPANLLAARGLFYSLHKAEDTELEESII